MKWPNSLTVDHVAKHLYWADYLQQRIELCDFNGNNRRQFITTLAGPSSLTLFSRFVYWSEWQPNVLRKSGKTQHVPATTVMNGLKRVTGIQAVNLRKVPGL
jgi:low density lipoprotein-related protein 2